jgi:hypothetical protein
MLHNLKQNVVYIVPLKINLTNIAKKMKQKISQHLICPNKSITYYVIKMKTNKV